MPSTNRVLETIISQHRPILQTRKALLVIGLQNDFISPDGKLPASVSDEFWPALDNLIPAFREFGEVVWVTSEFDGPVREFGIMGSSGKVEYDDGSSEDEQSESDEHRGAIDGYRDSPVPLKRRRISIDDNESTPTLDAIERAETPDCSSGKPLSSKSAARRSSNGKADGEFFFSPQLGKQPCCLRDSNGAELCPRAKDLLDDDSDVQFVTSSYSAFGSGSLLMKLRSKLVTELFICGCPTNSSVYATAMDAAQNGFEIRLIEDCLAATTNDMNATALAHLAEILEAETMTGAEALEMIKTPRELNERDHESDNQSESDDEDGEAEDDLDEDQVENLCAVDGAKRDQGLRGGGEILIIDDDSSVYAQSSRDGSFVSPVLDTTYLLQSHLDQGMEGLQFSSSFLAEDHRSSAVGSSHRQPAWHRPNLCGPDTTRPHIPSHETGDPTPTEHSQYGIANDSNNKRRISELQHTSARHNVLSDESPNAEDWHQFVERWRHSSDLPTATSKDRGLNAIASVGRLTQKTVDHYEDMMKQARGRNCQPLFGEDKEAESHGSTIVYDLLPSKDAGTAFQNLKKEISWQRMYHQTGEVPRLVCCQGSIADDGSRPVYRHPSDQTLPCEPWTPTVDLIRTAAEEYAGHPLNHALIQFYRSGTDYISEHSDKTLDITKETHIINVSFGAQRTMRLRTKRAPTRSPTQPPTERTVFRVPMPHNSMIKMSLETNAKYLHGINADRRPAVELSAAEAAYDGGRISLTFRNIGTFLDAESTRIWGQGAVGKTRDCAGHVVNGDEVESDRLIRAFGAENQATSLQWDATYGAGSDVLHLKSAAAVAPLEPQHS